MFSVGDLVIFPNYVPVNNKYYYALIIDIFEDDRYLGEAYKCIMHGEIVTLTNDFIKKL